MSEVLLADRGMAHGARNLLLLSVFSVVIAVATTVAGLFLYVSSGDIYLDRSLPGLLPEESEKGGSGREEQYIFPDYGAVNKKALDDFLRYFDRIDTEVEEFKEPFADEPLSDEALILVYGDAQR